MTDKAKASPMIKSLSQRFHGQGAAGWPARMHLQRLEWCARAAAGGWGCCCQSAMHVTANRAVLVFHCPAGLKFAQLVVGPEEQAQLAALGIGKTPALVALKGSDLSERTLYEGERRAAEGRELGNPAASAQVHVG